MGDSGNDLDMLRKAGLSLVMSNGLDIAKAEADAIICFVNHGGNTASLLQKVKYRALKENIIIENLAM
jgi:hydroxymethylpyrimidine pyrophosphatase-like HAD family hydrolase